MAYTAFDLGGKAALVTGGNSGIGLGMAEALAQAGASVCIWGTNAEKNAIALKKIQSHGGKAIALRCDVGDEKAVEAAFAETVAALGPLHACFANAGVSGRSNPKSTLGARPTGSARPAHGPRAAGYRSCAPRPCRARGAR